MWSTCACTRLCCLARPQRSEVTQTQAFGYKVQLFAFPSDACLASALFVECVVSMQKMQQHLLSKFGHSTHGRLGARSAQIEHLHLQRQHAMLGVCSTSPWTHGHAAWGQCHCHSGKAPAVCKLLTAGLHAVQTRGCAACTQCKLCRGSAPCASSLWCKVGCHSRPARSLCKECTGTGMHMHASKADKQPPLLT
jgi:hypothetical protein